MVKVINGVCLSGGGYAWHNCGGSKGFVRPMLAVVFMVFLEETFHLEYIYHATFKSKTTHKNTTRHGPAHQANRCTTQEQTCNILCTIHYKNSIYFQK